VYVAKTGVAYLRQSCKTLSFVVWCSIGPPRSEPVLPSQQIASLTGAEVARIKLTGGGG
jgi:hypothetical protein